MVHYALRNKQGGIRSHRPRTSRGAPEDDRNQGGKHRSRRNLTPCATGVEPKVVRSSWRDTLSSLRNAARAWRDPSESVATWKPRNAGRRSSPRSRFGPGSTPLSFVPMEAIGIRSIPCRGLFPGAFSGPQGNTRGMGDRLRKPRSRPLSRPVPPSRTVHRNGRGGVVASRWPGHAYGKRTPRDEAGESPTVEPDFPTPVRSRGRRDRHSEPHRMPPRGRCANGSGACRVSNARGLDDAARHSGRCSARMSNATPGDHAQPGSARNGPHLGLEASEHTLGCLLPPRNHVDTRIGIAFPRSQRGHGPSTSSTRRCCSRGPPGGT